MSNIRYTCTCDPQAAHDQKDLYRYPRQVVLQLPEWSKARARRLQERLPPTVSIDGCIKHMILELWDKGIETTGCCCGHNFMPGWVSVEPDCFEAMFALGYFMKMPDIYNDNVYGLYTFYL